MATRLRALDVFRGLTIVAMIFVNDLASVRDIPGWLKHAPDGADTMTFVDVVFPAFLFIVGMAIPFALARRIDAHEGRLRPVLGHIVLRSFSLLILGFAMVNISFLDASATGIPKGLWSALLFLAAVMIWASLPDAVRARRAPAWSVKGAGVLLLIILAAVYRGLEGGETVWMQTRWWGILGLIGWTYLCCSLQFLAFRQSIGAHVGMLALYVALSIGDRSGALGVLAPVNSVLWLGGHVGGHASIATAGLCLGILLGPGGGGVPPAGRTRWMITSALMLWVGGLLLQPLFGISKNGATPAWSLFSAAACIGVFLVLQAAVNVQPFRPLFRLLEPAGENPLFAYLLPLALYPVISLTIGSFWDRAIGEGLLGIGRALFFSILVVWITGIASRSGLRLRL